MTMSFIAVVIGVVFSAVQAPATVSPLQPLEFLVGKWTGTSTGQPGEGAVEREYSFTLGGKFLQVRNRSVYAPQAKNPKGETHEDMGLFSFDRAKKQLVFRQFHVEGFVTQYRHDSALQGDALVFTSEAIENIPAGYRARETYRRIGADQIEEVFEMAEPGKEFAMYSRTLLKRAK